MRAQIDRCTQGHEEELALRQTCQGDEHGNTRFVPGSGWDEEHDHKIFMMQKKHHCAFEMIREYGSILKVIDLIQKWAVKGI
jgi:hypothetical protein